MPARFEIEVLTKFRSVGLSQIANEARTALQQVANQPGLSAATRVTRANEIRTQAERAISEQQAAGLAAARGSGLTGNALAAAEAQVNKEASQARRAVTRLFNELTKSTTDLGRRISRAVQQSGIPLATAAQARGAAAGAPPPSDAELRAAERARKARVRADAEEILGSDPGYYQSRQDERRAASARRAREAAQAAADQDNIRNTALEARAKKEEADRIRAATLGVRGAATRGISEVRVASALQAKVNADLEGARVARARAAAERNQTSVLARASAERRRAERELTQAIHLNAKAEVQQAIAAGEGSRFQRLQARFQAGGSSRLPTEFQGLGQFIGSRALTTIGYGLAGTALYGTARAIGDMVREAEELDRVLNQVEAQLDAVGSGSQFEGARQGILRIARETGAAADEVAAVQFQFQGAFGALEDGSIDAQRALVETEAAMKVVAVTGLSIKEVLDSLTATARTFNVGIEEIGDTALGVQERFGVMATETITFVADLAPVAEQIGLSLEDLASLGGVAQQVSGKSGAALAEGFGRIFPQLQELRSEILEIYNLPQLQSQRANILEGFATGDTGAVFQRLVRDFNSLSKAQQAFVIDMLGGRREAQVLIPVLQNASLLTRDWDRNLAGLNDTSGKTDDYFERLQTTVGNASARFGEAVRQIGEGLFRAGAADAFVAITNAAASLADVLTFLINQWGRLNDFLGGAPTRLLAYVAAFRLLRAAVGISTRAIAAKTSATALETRTAAQSAAANQTEAAAFNNVAGAATRSAAAVTADTAADTANAASSARAAQMNSAQGLPYAPAGGPGRLASFGQTLAGGGSLFGKAIPGRLGGALNIGRSYSGLVGITLAMEGLNQYFKNAAEQTAELDKLRADIDEKFAETDDIDAEAQKLMQQAAEQRARGLNEGVSGLGPLNAPVNLIGGKARSWLGIGSDAENDAILRTAAGEPQDYEVLEQEATKARSEQYQKIIETVLAQGRGPERLVESLRQADLNAVSEVIAANQDFLTAPVREVFLPKNEDKALQDWADGVADKGDITQENIEKLLAAAAEGDQLAAEIIRLIANYINDNPALKGLLDAGTANEVEEAAKEAAGGTGNYELQNLETAKQQFEAGTITISSYLKEAREARKNIADAITASKLAGETPLIADIVALAEADKDIAERVASGVQSRIDALGTAVDLASGGSARVSGALLDQQIALVESFIRTNTGTQEQQFAQIPVLIGLLREKFEQDLAGIADEAARARAEAAGFTIPPSLQALFVEQQLVADPAIAGMIEQVALLTGMSLDQVFTEVANIVATTEYSVVEATKQVIKKKIAQLTDVLGRLIAAGASGESFEAINNAIAVLQAELDNLPETPEPIELGGTGYSGGGGGGGKTAEELAEERRRAAQARAEAQLNVARAYAEGDPERLAQIELQAAAVARQYAEDDAGRLNAEADRIRAMNAIREAQEDIVRARYELYAAQVQRDPVRSARAQVSLAYIAIAQAKGTAERIRAQIQMVNAQQTLLAAQQDVTIAWLEGIQSYFNIIGDSVRAAQTALQIAQQQLKNVLADRNSGAAERTRARTAVAEAQAAVRDAKYNDQLGDIEYMLELEKISVAQAIQMLQRMAEIPGLTEEQLRNIERRIRDLRESVSGDLNFNIPDIVVPGLYEVRRLMGASSTPSGTYQDNRQVSVTLQISENVDAGPVMNQLADMLNAPSITGIYPRNY